MNDCFEMLKYILNPKMMKYKQKLNWRELWIEKSDYIESFYNNIKGKYKVIDESINYYLGMIETSIYYLKNNDNYYDYSYIQHKIILKNNFFDKKNFKIDIKERDYAEFLKYMFYNEKYSIDDLYNIIDNNKNFNYHLVVARLIYPSYYIFFLERMIIDGKESKKLVDIINKANKYEEYIMIIINRINKVHNKKIVSPF